MGNKENWRKRSKTVDWEKHIKEAKVRIEPQYPLKRINIRVRIKG